MAEFLWIEWNLQKIDSHALSTEEVEHAWNRRRDLRTRRHATGGLYTESLGECPSGRTVRIVWRYNEVGGRDLVFVITAY